VPVYIGLMSGTSLDGVDAVLARIDPGTGPACQVLAHVHQPFEHALRNELLALNTCGPDELRRSQLAGNALARAYARAVSAVLALGVVDSAAVKAIGAHGQTVRHCPGGADAIGYSVQLLNGSLLSELCRMAVACDFRSADLAAGGQGAPLVPAFHAAVFGDPAADVAVLNIGGIANLTLLPALGEVTGFDCGPGNVLLDLFVSNRRGLAYDEGGRWAASGSVLPDVLEAWWSGEAYFHRAPPKSTGRDLFHADWLAGRLSRAVAHGAAAEDVMCTLAELTVVSVVRSLASARFAPSRLMVCGGGARNAHLLDRLSAALPGVPVEPTDAWGLPAEQVEAAAFAWLAGRRLAGMTGNLPAVTGARGARVLGALYEVWAQA